MSKVSLSAFPKNDLSSTRLSSTMISCPWCTILGALPLVSLVFAQGLRPVERRGLSTRNKRDKIGNEHEPQLYRELTASYDDSTDAETLFPFEFEPMDPINSEGDFVGYCKEWFLFFEDDHSNAFISQGDLIDFIVDVCTVFEGDDIPDFDCPRPTFRTISERVQFMFVQNLCNGKDVAVCLQTVLNNGTEFGYHEDLTKSLFLEDLCCNLVQFISLVGLRKNSGKPHAVDQRDEVIKRTLALINLPHDEICRLLAKSNHSPNWSQFCAVSNSIISAKWSDYCTNC